MKQTPAQALRSRLEEAKETLPKVASIHNPNVMDIFMTLEDAIEFLEGADRESYVE